MIISVTDFFPPPLLLPFVWSTGPPPYHSLLLSGLLLVLLGLHFSQLSLSDLGQFSFKSLHNHNCQFLPMKVSCVHPVRCCRQLRTSILHQKEAPIQYKFSSRVGSTWIHWWNLIFIWKERRSGRITKWAISTGFHHRTFYTGIHSFPFWRNGLSWQLGKARIPQLEVISPLYIDL